MYSWIANHMPRRLLYWAVIRAWAIMTVDIYPNRTPDDITVFETLKELNPSGR